MSHVGQEQMMQDLTISTHTSYVERGLFGKLLQHKDVFWQEADCLCDVFNRVSLLIYLAVYPNNFFNKCIISTIPASGLRVFRAAFWHVL